MSPRGEAAAAGRERDRLSALPDDLLHRILRPLDARQAAGDLSLLSRRWRRVWASSPFVTLEGDSACSETFGNNLLLLRDPADLLAFRLHSSDWMPFIFQRRWLRHALSRGLRVLEPTLGSGHGIFTLPDCIFSCATLEEIDLSATPSLKEIRCSPDPNKPACLPRLKKLRLENLVIEPSAAEKLSSVWPSLEDLDLSRCSIMMIYSRKDCPLKISSETLKRLSITSCIFEEIHVYAPNTESLKITVSGGRLHLSAMPSLVSAWVYVSAVVHHLAPCTYDLVAALCNVQRLELFRFDLLLQDIVQKSATQDISFRNLKSLYVGEWLVTNFYNALSFFIQRAPNLADLALDQWKFYRGHSGSISDQLYREWKPGADGKLKLIPALPKNLETLWIRLSRGDNAKEFRKMRSSLKEKTKPRKMRVVWF